VIKPLYSEVLTIKEYGFTPSIWKRLSNIDKKILGYARIMESYYIEFSPERIKMREQIKDAEHKKKMDKIMDGLPKQQKGRR
jgi:hypothetical protein